MALIFPGSRCAICNEELSQLYLATSGCAFPPEHRLFKFCDAPLHLSCLEEWDDREEFAGAYHDLELDSWRRGRGTLLHLDDKWFVGVGPSAPPSTPRFAQVRLRDWPLRLYTQFDDWDVFLADGYSARLGGQTLSRADAVMRDVRNLLPNQAELVATWRRTVS